MPGAPPRSRTWVQLGFLLGGLLAVAVADQIALEVRGGDVTAVRLRAVVVVAGRVLAGWSAGMAFRLGLAPRARTDPSLRVWLGAPMGAVAAWPLARTWLPPSLQAALPGWTGELVGVAPVAGILLGLVLTLAVSRSGR